MSLYGIETEGQCWSKIDELLELTQHAKKVRTKEAVTALKNRLKEYYDLGNSNMGHGRMSEDEKVFFWPSISEAYAESRLNVNSPKTWDEGVSTIEYKLNKYRH